jgi:hypothetical protein
MTDKSPTPAILDQIPYTTLDAWREFVDYWESLTEVGLPTEVPYLFRGQPDADWSLLPLFTRYANEARLTIEQALRLENQALTEFTRQAHLHLTPNILRETSGLMGWWSLMQHYRAPTRLLDWTKSPCVAAYFAVAEHLDKPGAIWVVHVRTVKDYMKTRYGQEHLPLNQGDAAEREALCSPEARPTLYFVRRPRETDRMAAQQGYFSVSPQVLTDHADLLHAATLNVKPDPQFFRFVIRPDLKLKFLRTLLAMNVTARALFPGVDGLGKTVEELVRVTSLSIGETL